MSLQFVGPHALEAKMVKEEYDLFESLMVRVDLGELTLAEASAEFHADTDADQFLGKVALSA